MRGRIVERYVVAGNRPWNRPVYDEMLATLPGTWVYVRDPSELEAALAAGRPRYVFFLHWSWIVPDQIVDSYECINFHMTDVPYGRGGSPLQNLIVRGHTHTTLTAMRMTPQLDAGPVYDKRPLSLEGTAQEIYERASRLAARMIADLVRDEPEPRPQIGEPVLFERRRPEHSRIDDDLEDLTALYDHIRMLDAEGYPHAFLDEAGFRFRFRGAELSADGDELRAEVIISRVDPGREQR